MKPTVWLAIAGLCLLAGLALGWGAKPTPKPTYRNVIVPDTVIVHEAPDTVLRFVDRIKWKVVEPTVVAHGETRDTLRLAAYCHPDTVRLADSTVGLVAVLPPTSGKYNGKTLSLFATTSDGALYNQQTEVTPPFEWVNRDGQYEVRTTRTGFHLLKGLPGALVKAAVVVGAFELGRATK